MTKTPQQLLLASLVGALIALPACKPRPQDSALRSLDNYAAGKTINRNFCSASRRDVTQPDRVLLVNRVVIDRQTGADPNLTVLLRSEAISALTAVPPQVQRMFLALGGYINIHTGTTERCQGVAAGNKAAACLSLAPDPDTGQRQSLDIYIEPNPLTIRHELVRQFGFFAAQFAGKLKVSAKTGQLRIVRQPLGFKTAKARLALAFLEDINDSKFFHKRRFQRPQEMNRDALEEAIADHVFAEAFDSYYCNTWGAYDEKLAKRLVKGNGKEKEIDRLQNTRQLMQDFFPETYSSFRRLATELGFDRKNFRLQEEAAPAGVNDQADMTPPNIGDQAMLAGHAAEPSATEAQASLNTFQENAASLPDTGAGGDLTGLATSQGNGEPLFQQRHSTSTCHNPPCRDEGLLGFDGSADDALLPTTPSPTRQQTPDPAVGQMVDILKAGGGTSEPTTRELRQRMLREANGPQEELQHQGFTIAHNAFIPDKNAVGESIGTVSKDPDGESRRYFREPGTELYEGPISRTYASGDNRKPHEAGTSRLNQRMDFDKDGRCIAAEAWCNESHRKSKNIWTGRTTRAKDTATAHTDLKGLGTTEAELDARAAYPFLPSPNINNKTRVETTKTKNGSFFVNAEFGHDKFPAGEGQIHVKMKDGRTAVVPLTEWLPPRGSSPYDLPGGVRGKQWRDVLVTPAGKVMDTKTGLEIPPIRILDKRGE